MKINLNVPKHCIVLKSEFNIFFQVKGNVDLLKLIQLGITLFDSGGHLPEGVCTWQVVKLTFVIRIDKSQ